MTMLFAAVVTVCTAMIGEVYPAAFDSYPVSPSPMMHIQNTSVQVATLQEQTVADAAVSLSNTSLADLQNDTDTQRLQLRYRERKRQERLFLIQSQILRRLGISRQPNTTLPIIPEEERRKIIDIIERVQSTPGQGSALPVHLHAERVQSFYPTCGAVPVNTERNVWEDENAFRLYYDIEFPRPTATTEISIVSAKLRLYKRDQNVLPPCPECDTTSNNLPQDSFMDSLYRCASRGINVSVYQYTKPLRAFKREKKRLVDSRIVSVDARGWIDFNIYSAVNHWFHHRSKNYGLEIEVANALGTKKSTSAYFQKMNCTEGVVVQDPPFPNIMNMHPDMGENESALFDNETYPTLDLQTIELSREEPPTQTNEAGDEHVVRKRQIDDVVLRRITAHKMHRHRSGLLETTKEWNCRPEKLYVTFEELGLNDIVLAPIGFHTVICKEKCQHHRHVFKDGVFVRKAWSTCVPTSYESLSVLYWRNESEISLTLLKDFLVRSCSCHSSS